MPNKPRLTTEQFIAKSKLVHGETYDYSKSVYVRNNIHLEIVCREHGPFMQVAINHLQGGGCSKCARSRVTKAIRDSKVLSLEEVKSRLSRFENISIPNLDTEYVDGSSEITCICPTHGEFKDTFRRLDLSTYGCVPCSKIIVGKKRRRDIPELKSEIDKVWGGKYLLVDIDSEYISNKAGLRAICDEHGEFIVRANDILTKGCGCPRCGKEITFESLRLSMGEVKDRLHTLYAGKYTLDEASFPHGGSTKQRCSFTCQDHGPYSQTLADCLGGHIGCTKCGHNKSGPEETVSDLLTDWGIQHSRRVRSVCKYEADILIESRRIVIEVNGNYWHSSARKNKFYHREKRELFESLNHRVIQLWEDEIISRPEKVSSYLKTILGIGIAPLNARSCTISELGPEVALPFIEANHLQGKGATSRKYLGIWSGTTLVGAASFRGSYAKGSDIELHRVAYLSGVRVRGGLSKLMSKAKEIFPGVDIVSFIDRDKFDGGSYYKSGFKYVSSYPMLWYFSNGERHSRHKFKKTKLKDSPNYSPEKTERQILEESKIYQIWNSGIDKVVLKPGN